MFVGVVRIGRSFPIVAERHQGVGYVRQFGAGTAKQAREVFRVRPFQIGVQ
jgi:hypothetical protein